MKVIDLSKYSAEDSKSARKPSFSEDLHKLLNTEIKVFEKKFGPQQKLWFYPELSMLLKAGVDIKTAFDIIEQETENKKHLALISQIKADLMSGKTLSEACKRHANVFSNYEWQSIKIGEETGKLPDVLNELGSFYKASIKLKQQIVGTLTYPVIVLCIAVLIVYFMLSFVVPMFADIFKQSGAELPAMTQILIKLSDSSSLMLYGIISSGFVTGIVITTQKKKVWFRHYSSALILKIPIVNKLIQKIYLARFCQSMQLLLGARVLLIDALNLVRNMIGFYPIEFALECVEKDILKGNSLNESLSKHKIFPQKLTALIKVSEEVNAPETIFLKLNQQYSEEIEHQQAIIGKIIEPFFMILLGLIVGFILLAMYLPLFQLSNVIK